jgi:hypothetical protein
MAKGTTMGSVNADQVIELWLASVKNSLEAGSESVQADLDEVGLIGEWAPDSLALLSCSWFMKLVELSVALDRDLYVSMSIPLDGRALLIHPGDDVLGLVNQISYPRDLAGYQIPGFFISKENPSSTELNVDSTVRTSLEHHFVSSRPISVEHVAEGHRSERENFEYIVFNCYRS